VKRIITVLTIAALAVASALPAFAQEEPAPVVTRNEFEFTFTATLPNPCTGEEVEYTITSEGFTQLVTTPEGSFLTRFHLRSSGTGEGLTSHETYSFDDVVNDELGSNLPLPGTRTQNVRIIDPGSGKPFVMALLFQIDAEGNVHFLSAGTQCL
jgi:hypothetical protein